MGAEADLVIIGAGCAGLALAARLRGAGRTIVALDPRETYENDRTWCFWGDGDGDVTPILERRWTSWRISDGARAIVHECADRPYQMISADAYYDWARSRVATDPRIELRLGVRAEAIARRGAGFVLETSRGPVGARRVVDTRPPSVGDTAEAVMEQVFFGQEIATSAVPASVGLMERMRSDEHGFAFDYILPIDEGRVLLEATRFAPPGLPIAVLKRDLADAADVRGWSDAPVIRQEAGRLPMGLPDRSAPSPGWVRAGTGGGALRASSGYGFMRIQSWARACADVYLKSGEVVGQRRDPAFRRWMDGGFLRAVARSPDRAPDYFMRIAQALDGAGFARFMSDHATPADWLRTAAALPPRPFMSAAFSPGRARPLQT